MSRSSHISAVLQALLVTFLWSTSWVLIKIGLVDIPALTFAGLRYTLAFLCLLPLGLCPANRAYVRRLTGRDWMRLLTLGFLMYTLTQGAQFAALVYLPSVTLSLLLSFSAVVAALLAMAFLREQPRTAQWLGVGVYLFGVLVYFWPVMIPTQEGLGLGIGLFGVVANASAAVVGRFVNRDAALPALVVTLVSMGFGAVVLLTAGVVTQGLPVLSVSNWAIILWLAVVNTAFAFTLWNHTLRTLTAVESSIINNMMLAQIAILAWIFLGETFSLVKGIGMALATLGILIVQLYGRRLGEARRVMLSQDGDS